MARPLKKGLGYFPLDTRFLSNRKIQRLAQRYGCKGICIYIATLCEVYGEKGYYAHFDRDFCFDVGFSTGQEETFVEEVILFCVQIKLFDKRLLEQEQTLTSEGIQQRYEEISKRAKVQIKENEDGTVNWEDYYNDICSYTNRNHISVLTCCVP